MRPVNWDELAKICEREGFKLDRIKGDHYIMIKPGVGRPVVIPKKKGLTENIVLSVARTIGLDRRTMEARLNSKGKSGKRGPLEP